MTAEYIAKYNAYAAKEILKQNGFRWDAIRKVWHLPDGIASADRVLVARKEIKAAEINCHIEFMGEGFRPPEDDPAF